MEFEGCLILAFLLATLLVIQYIYAWPIIFANLPEVKKFVK